MIGTAYPWAPGHVVLGPQDTDVVPHLLHPSFQGSLDWHSCVHMQWSLVTLLSRYAAALGEDERLAARALLDERLTADTVLAETDYLRARPGFERPYGWAWAAQLGAATAGLAAAGADSGQRDDELSARAGVWSAALEPLTDLIADRVLQWLPRQAYPVRHGTHQNGAFALVLLHDAYGRLGREDVVAATAESALAWYGADGLAPTVHEPSGSDFLSPALTSAVLMTRVLPPEQARAWLSIVLPGLGAGQHDHLLRMPRVLDPSDGQGAHLLGLALSRAWALRALAPLVETGAADRLRTSADEQEAAVLKHIVEGDFMATHWLVSFALLADGALERP